MNLIQQQLNNDINEDSDGSLIGRKNNQNTFSWSSTSSSNSTLLSSHSNSTSTTTHEQNETHLYLTLLNEFQYLSEDKKEKRVSEIVCRSASHGDLNTIRQVMMDSRLSSYLNLDASDDETDGSTPLIYACCFGKLDVVRYLLEVGRVNVDVQDKIGWTALMWATTNGHSQIVQLLLEYSASSETKSLSGRTIYDLMDVQNEQMFNILSPTMSRSNSYCSSSMMRRASFPRKLSVASSNSTKSSNSKMNALDRNNTSSPSVDTLASISTSKCEASFRSVHKFIWDQCLPDQMFVFAEEEIDHILNVSISQLKLPMKSRSEIYVPSNIIFLCARFAHYYTSRELVSQLLTKAVKRIDTVVKSNSQDIHTLSFWIANLSQLLYYLKKDVGLVVVTAEYQLEISELISETYTLLVQDSERRMNRILEPAMIEFEQISIEVIDFADDWQRFFRRNRHSHGSINNRKSIHGDMLSPPSPQQHIQSSLSPQSLTSLLTSILYVLQSYDVHPVIVIQAMAQLFHFLSCEIFNRILCNKKYLCRSKALQIRMNLTQIEEWVRDQQLPSTLSAYFNPVIQLVQLLQCVSQLQDLMDFINTTKSFELLNPMQIKRLVLNYRYEVSETKLPDEIEKYTMQIAEDTLRSIQSEQQQDSKKSSIDSFRIPPRNNSRPTSISSLGSLLQTISNNNRNKKTPNNRLSIASLDECHDTDNLDFLISEKRDSKYMLPFSLPTTTNMVHAGWGNMKEEPQESNAAMSLSDKIYHELKTKLSAEREKNARERNVIPTIPEEWLEILDKTTAKTTAPSANED